MCNTLHRTDSTENNMGIKVYGLEVSAPVRVVMMTAEVLGVDYEFIKVDLMAGDNMKPEYLKVNNIEQW